jgi:hypothetical protein
MPWIIRFGDEFEGEFLALNSEVQDRLLASAKLLADYRPDLGRPYVDTLKGSKHANMKELRFNAARGVWRVAFAFDSRRHGILLVAGDKSGVSEARFYKQLIATADRRYAAHLARITKPSSRKG